MGAGVVGVEHASDLVAVPEKVELATQKGGVVEGLGGDIIPGFGEEIAGWAEGASPPASRGRSPAKDR